MCLRMCTRRAYLRRFRPFMDIAAIGAMPLYGGFLFKDLAFLDVGQQFTVAAFMELFHLGDFFKGGSDIRKALFFSGSCSFFVEDAPFHFLTCGGGFIFYSAFHPSVLPPALITLFSEQGLGNNSPSVRFMLGLGILLPGNLIWRVICEAAILFYSMHERLVSIEDRLRVR